jgi:hypothetical protein
MKNEKNGKLHFFAIAAFVIFIILGLASTQTAPPPEYGISGTPIVGRTITVSGPPSDRHFVWQLSSTNGPHDWNSFFERPTGSVSQNIEITSNMVGRWIRATRRLNNGDTWHSNVLGPIQRW